jgi:dipeptidyl-peptidase-4
MIADFTRAFARIPLLVALSCAAAALPAQTPLTMSDAILKGRSALAPASLRQLAWIPGTEQFCHVLNGKLVRVDAATLRTDTFDLLSRFNAEMTAQRADPLPALPFLNWREDGTFWIDTGKDIYAGALDKALQRQNSHPADAENIDVHPKTLFAAYTRGNDLWVSLAEKEIGVAQHEGEGIVYGKSVHRDEFGIHSGTFWSNSGRFLAFYRMDESMVTPYPIYILDSMPAQVRTVRYPFSGAKSHQVSVGVFDTRSGQKHYLQMPAEPGPEQYLTNIAWSPDDRYLLVAVVNRAQNHLWLRQFDAATGAFVKTILEESNDKWVEPEQPAAFLPGSDERFLWQSERDGYNQLYLCDLSGKNTRQISQGAMPVTNFYGFDAKGEHCFYQVADETGLNRHLFSANLRSGQLTRLSGEEGVHNGLFSSNGNWALDVFSNLETPRFVFVQSVKNPSERRIVFGAKNPLDGYQLGLTRLLSLPSPGGPQLNARMILPPNFDAQRQYPALVYVYNGPHVQMVTNNWLGGGELWMHRMAQEGYIVFALDGRGSANRGFAFESAIHRRLADCEMEDQLTGVNYLKAQTFVDPQRIGVYGWSYGGFMTTSLLSRPEAKGVFRCGVAGGPVIDWRMYEIMYTERYMDSPQENPEGYAKNSLFNHIDGLAGRLLMIHGSSDDVVLWQHSMRYIRECVRKGKQIDYFVYPEHLHNVMGRDRVHLFEKIEQFFHENLRDAKTDKP